jgi:CRISPR/Cas system Type II protein with McrA/HNH and RuvC-like nuclease domain
MDKVLVLNSDYTPINVTSVIRGYVLVLKGKAEILKSAEKPIVSGKTNVPKPLVIRLLSYVRFRVKSLKINRHRIFRRDNHECVYCGGSKHLTIDHILPKSRGGNNTWTNLVTCCRTCNRIKDNKTPDEANMKLRYKPFEPTIFSNVINPQIEDIWIEFQKEFMS